MDDLGVFKQALAFTLPEEGGISNVEQDKGGLTNRGITHKTLDLFNQKHPELNFPSDVRDLTSEQTETIYRLFFWYWDGIKDPKVAIKMFDIGVNTSAPSCEPGPKTSIMILQRAINTVPMTPPRAPLAVDGYLGTITLGRCNIIPSDVMLDAICLAQRSYYLGCITRNPEDRVFQNGWLKRAARKP